MGRRALSTCCGPTDTVVGNVACGSDSESLAASKTSPLALKQPTQALIAPKDRLGPLAAMSAVIHSILMSTLVRYLTHPQVQVDPTVPVPSWGLSAVGRARVLAMVAAGWLRGTKQVIASAERKALETAEPIASALGVQVEVRDAMHENDRSATGFLPPREFEAVADQFFAHPDKSIRGWERARDAQKRIVREAEAVLSRSHEGHVLLLGTGRSAHFSIAITPMSRSIACTISPRVAGTTSQSTTRGARCFIGGVVWKTRLNDRSNVS
jgi:broad specificity phosphatase PhoE